MFNKKVTIIGAGPSGLCLATLLQQANIQVSVFERDSITLGRDQGGSLDMHSDYGQIAIKGAGLYEEFLKMSRVEGEATKILESTTLKLLFEDGSAQDSTTENEDAFSKPEIDRMDLRNLFLNALSPGTVEWNKAVDCIKKIESSEGQYQINFKDGSSHVTDLLVGCDGAWSKVRSAFTQTKPTYSGVYFIESKLQLDRNDDLARKVIEMTGKGSLFSLYNNKGLLAQRNSNHIRFYYCLRMDKELVEQTIHFEKGPEVVKQQLLELFNGWDDSLLDFIRVIECNDDFSFIKRPLYSLPPEWDWKTQPGVTIIGDAAHVMTPFAGLGANLALLDAHDLAQFLIHGRDGIASETQSEVLDWNGVIASFEAKMFERSKGAAQQTEYYLNSCLCDGNPDKFIEAMLAHHTEDHNQE
ncbi:predicted protein [Naegleria gruberi]|uniref:Predicted protein n=1 Tax=Naegleria gruberi TaxID=5762 RepID=D2VVD7_NAEGR|nr:uncharacterized protein NAEGRDRAFT_52560 [Naegleria gruberi]EFC39294.1 predicted protein [Naegleria gruberi]|eukprot:XP_002672038.1 predicted protein [Naegleria gruberi strain NEG-M]